MNATYKKLLETTYTEEGKSAIQKQIDFNNQEIAQLKGQQTQIFSKKEPLNPLTKVIEKNPEGDTTTTVINGPKVTPNPPVSQKAPTRLENDLRKKIQAAKAAKKAK